MSVSVTRGQELRIKGHLYEIRQINGEVIGGEQGYPMAEAGYRKTLRNVAHCSNSEAVDEVAQRIKELLKQRRDRPSNRKIRRYARKVVSEEGLPPSAYLNRA